MGDDTQWLTYWVVYSFFTTVEAFTDVLLHWIPFYYFCKIVFLMWLMSPHFRGATVIFNSFILPTLDKYEATIDNAGKDAAKMFNKLEDEVRSKGGDLVQR